jgi:ribosomal protein L24
MPCELSSSGKLLLVSFRVLLTVSDVSIVTSTKTMSSQESKDSGSYWIDIASIISLSNISLLQVLVSPHISRETSLQITNRTT